MTPIEKIRAEIERKQKENLAQFNKRLIGLDTLTARDSQLLHILSFLDTLETEERKKHNITLANTDTPKNDSLEVAFQDIWEGVETLESVKILSEVDKEKLKGACHDWFEAGTIWQREQVQAEAKEVDLEKFTEKMDAWKARYNHPDNIPIKATMAFTARMFYMYPDIAREWYESLPKATMDNTRKEE